MKLAACVVVGMAVGSVTNFWIGALAALICGVILGAGVKA